jgi:hypothetical protein
MFYDVKILNPQGKIKKIISGPELKKRYWEMFYYTESNKTLNSTGVKQVPSWVKKKLDMDFVQFRDQSSSA